MHIVDGVLSAPVLIGGAVLSAAAIAKGLRNMPIEKIPVTGMLAATFFVASLVYVPAGPTSVHLIMNGMAGLVLGWAVFPALFIGLLLQAVLFGYGGLTVLGVNTINIALPALMIGMLLKPFLNTQATRLRVMCIGAIAGGGAVAMSAFMVSISLLLSGEEYTPAAFIVLFNHLPVVVVEALLSSATLVLLSQVKPELLYQDL